MPTLIRRFLAYYVPYKKLFVLDFSCAVTAAILEIGFPLFVNYVIDSLLPSMNWSLIVIACAGLLGVYGLTAGDFNARVEDNISGIRVVQAFANEEHEKSLFARNNTRFRAAKLGAYKVMAWSSSLSYMFRQGEAFWRTKAAFSDRAHVPEEPPDSDPG